MAVSLRHPGQRAPRKTFLFWRPNPFFLSIGSLQPELDAKLCLHVRWRVTSNQVTPAGSAGHQSSVWHESSMLSALSSINPRRGAWRGLWNALFTRFIEQFHTHRRTNRRYTAWEASKRAIKRQTFTSQSQQAKDKQSCMWWFEGSVGAKALRCTGSDIQQHTVRLEITG